MAKRRRRHIPAPLVVVPDVLTPLEAAAYLRLPLSSLYEKTSSRTPIPLPRIKISHQLRFRRLDLDRWLAQKAVTA